MSDSTGGEGLCREWAALPSPRRVDGVLRVLALAWSMDSGTQLIRKRHDPYPSTCGYASALREVLG